MNEAEKEIRCEGVAASPGVVRGPLFILARESLNIERKSITEADVPREIEALRKALDESIRELEALYQKTAEAYSAEAAQIFQVHQAMLSDPFVLQECVKLIEAEKIGAAEAFATVMDLYIERLSDMGDETFRARSVDLRDLKRRVLQHLLGKTSAMGPRLDRPSIIFARELTPSDTIRLDRSLVLGFAMDFGARTSHATILARSIKVPAVVGLNDAVNAVREGALAILDGEEGVLIINPSRETLARYERRRQAFLERVHHLEEIRFLPARTRDGKDIELACNIEFVDEADAVHELGSDGVGLYRTEYLYLSNPEIPSEEYQLDEYRRVLNKLNGKPLIIRTFDLGGDKLPIYLQLQHEQNPFLGVRGVRLYFNGAPGLFRTQLRAVLRAAAEGNIYLMLPMITCAEEVVQCRRIIEEVKEELRREGLLHAEEVKLGAMIEVPSAAVTADLIARECDFLSIGTNDLVQYTVAVDRGNKDLNYLYQPFHPAVFRLISDIIQKAHAQGVWVGMCGEMAGDPLATMTLIGLGLDEFSVSPVSLLTIKEIIRNVEVEECEQVAAEVLAADSIKGVRSVLKESYERKFPKQD